MNGSNLRHFRQRGEQRRAGGGQRLAVGAAVAHDGLAGELAQLAVEFAGAEIFAVEENLEPGRVVHRQERAAVSWPSVAAGGAAGGMPLPVRRGTAAARVRRTAAVRAGAGGGSLIVARNPSAASRQQRREDRNGGQRRLVSTPGVNPPQGNESKAMALSLYARRQPLSHTSSPCLAARMNHGRGTRPGPILTAKKSSWAPSILSWTPFTSTACSPCLQGTPSAEWVDDKAPTLGAAMAYYTVFLARAADSAVGDLGVQPLRAQKPGRAAQDQGSGHAICGRQRGARWSIRSSIPPPSRRKAGSSAR